MVVVQLELIEIVHVRQNQDQSFGCIVIQRKILNAHFWEINIVSIVELVELDWSCFHLDAEMLENVLNQFVLPLGRCLLRLYQVSFFKQEAKLCLPHEFERNVTFSSSVGVVSHRLHPVG